jgi:hypothetical protein
MDKQDGGIGQSKPRLGSMDEEHTMDFATGTAEMEELQTKYECKDFKDISKCFALLDIRLSEKVEKHDVAIRDLDKDCRS